MAHEEANCKEIYKPLPSSAINLRRVYLVGYVCIQWQTLVAWQSTVLHSTLLGGRRMYTCAALHQVPTVGDILEIVALEVHVSCDRVYNLRISQTCSNVFKASVASMASSAYQT